MGAVTPDGKVVPPPGKRAPDSAREYEKSLELQAEEQQPTSDSVFARRGYE